VTPEEQDKGDRMGRAIVLDITIIWGQP